jgi:hypothetical protein
MLTIDPIDYSVEIDRGDDQEMEIPIVDSDGNPINVTGASFRLTVKSSLDDAIGAAIFQLTNPIGNGLDVAAAATGIIVAYFPHLYLEPLAGEYVYDFEMTLNGKVRTIVRAARFFVHKDVTTPGAVTNPGVYWKKVFENGQENTYGPSAAIPF